jgi:hypothetical protein
MPVKVGFIHGTSAALNIEIGFVPDWVRIYNATDGENIFEGWLPKLIVFTSLSTALRGGMWLKGITSGAVIRVRDVIIDSGTVAAGNAAGWLIVNQEDINGTITSAENCQIYEQEPVRTTAATNHITFTAADVTFGMETITSAGPISATSDALIEPYVGTEGVLRKGFTIGTQISEDGDLLSYVAIANDPGQAQEPEVAGVKQSEAAW